MKWFFIPLFTSIGLVFAHWSSLRLYQAVCSPSGWYGFLASFLTSPSSWCHSLLNLHVKIAEWYTLWVNQFMLYVIAAATTFVGSIMWYWKKDEQIENPSMNLS